MLKTIYTTLLVLFSTFSFSQTTMSIIEDSPNHNTLEALINSAGLNATLSGAGTFTVFAPTDAAFASLDPGLVATLTNDPSGKLTKGVIISCFRNRNFFKFFDSWANCHNRLWSRYYSFN